MILIPARATIVLLGCATAMLSVGCSPAMSVAPPPSTCSECELAQDSTTISYPVYVVLLHNLQRTLDPDLAENARLSSFCLVERLGEDWQELLVASLAFVVNDRGAPVELRRRAADYLLARKGDVPTSIALGSSVEPGASR